MAGDRRSTVLGGALLLLLMLCACPEGQPVPNCEERRPDGYGRTCSGDGECATYLKCIDTECVLPPTMSGMPESTTVELAFRPALDADAFLTFDAEHAATELERRRGLSFRPCMQPEWAMLFVYPQGSTQVSHQTLDMQYDIDIAFVGEDGVVRAVYHDLKAGRVSQVGVGERVAYVVEAAAGDLGPVSRGDVVTWRN